MHRHLLALVLAGVFAQQDPTSALTELDGLHVRHQQALRVRSIGELVALDGQLRRFFLRRPSIDGVHYKPEYEDLGISVGHYSGSLQYSGQILAEAHGINPRSAFRSHTLYSAVRRDEEGPPDIGMATTYVREFPRGPFAARVHAELAWLYHDLVTFLRERQAGEPLTHDCYEMFVTDGPLVGQIDRATATAIMHYERSLELDGTYGRDMRKAIADLKSGTQAVGYHYCGD